MRDVQAVETAGCTVPRDHDVRPRYDSTSGLFPKGWDAMDVDRHRVACSEKWTQVRESWGRKRVTCGDCRRILIASSWRELKALMAEHLK